MKLKLNGSKIKTIFYYTLIIGLFCFNIIYGLKNKALKKEITLQQVEIFHQVIKPKNLHLNGLVKDSILYRKGGQKKTNIIVYRFFNSECFSCILNDLSLIKSVLTSCEVKDILILPNIPETRNESISVQNLLEGFEFYPVPKSCMSIPSNNPTQDRFFALVDTTGMVQMIFYPNNELPNLTKEYLKICLKKISH